MSKTLVCSLKEHNISGVDATTLLGFNPARVLQIAQTDIGFIKGILDAYRRFGDEHIVAYESMAQKLPLIIRARRETIEIAMELTESLHDITEHYFGSEADRAWEESKEDQFLVHYLSQSSPPP